MALTEKLQLIIDADGKGAIRGLEGVGAAADRNLGKTDDRLNRVGAGLTSFGTATVAAAAVAGAGLYKVAQSASAYGEQVSRATKVFGDEATPDLEAFADSAAETAGISKTAALQAASNFAAFGRQAGLTGKDLAGFSEEMVQSAGDFASLNDIPVDEAILAFGSALSGEAEPLKRFGVDVSDAAVQQQALDEGINKSTASMTQGEKTMLRYNILMEEGALWAGDFADTSDSLGNRQKQLAADFENAKVALGEGLLPFAENALGVVQGLAETFDGLSDSQKQAIGGVAGWAVVGAGLVGTLSLVAGQAIKMREAFIVAGDDGARSLTKLGRGAKYAAGALTVLVASDLILDWSNNVTGATDEVGQAVTRLATNVDNSTGDITQDFTDLVAAQGDVNSLAGIWEGFGRVFEFEGENMKYSIEDVDRAFDSLLESSPAAADAVVKDFKRQADAAEEGSQRQKDYTELYERHRGKVQEKKDADVAATRAQAEYNDEVARGAGLMDEAAGSTEDATSALEDYSNALKGTFDPLFGTVDALLGVGDAQRDVTEAQAKLAEVQADGSASAEDLAAAQRDLDDAQRGTAEAALDAEVALAGLATAIDKGEVSTDDANVALKRWVDQGYITADQAAFVAGAFGFAEGAATSFAKDYEATADANTNPFWGGILGAMGAADAFGNRRDASTIDADSRPFWLEAGRIDQKQFLKKTVRIEAIPYGIGVGTGGIGSHGGGQVSPQKGYIVGEQGPEFFTPSGAGSIIPNHDLGNHFGGGGGMGGNVYNISVAAGMANPSETGRAVVDAIRSYERVNGQGWRN